MQAADIYAFGVVLYQMVTGSLPFTGLTAEIMMKRVVQDAPSPRALVADLDERWEAVILRCLSRQPGDRFGYAEEVAEALAGRSPAVGAIALRRGLQALSSLPPERDSFLGREADLAGIESSWSGGSRVVALVGAAGMGKTRLAVHFGWLSLERWPGGVWFCDLTEANDKDGIATMVARSLSVPLGGGDALEQLGHAIAGHGRCLIILDNFEQVAKHAEDVLGRWLERAHHAGFLVTSRERLELRGQSVHMVEPLEAESGMDLFFDRARRQRPGLSFDERDRVSASEVVRMVDGMPLAIELAAARMRMMTLPELVVRVQEGQRVLGGQGHGRHATLRAAIDGSWDLLSPWERAAWAQCSVFEGGFTLEAAEAVLDLGAWAEAPWVVDVVQSLVDKSLLRTWVPEEPARTSVPEARFGMYLSLQQYARDRLREQGSDDESGTTAEQAAEVLHGRWYARMGSAEALDLLHGHGGRARWWRLYREMENMVVACRRAVARGDGPVATAAFCAVKEIVELRGPYILAVELGLDLIEKALDPADLGRALTTLGEMERLYGRTRESEVHLVRALALRREVGDRMGEAKVLNALGKLSNELGRLEEARRLYEATVAIAHENGLRGLEGLVRGNLAGLYVGLGRFEEATREFETALAIHRECGDRRLEGIALGNLGVLDADRGRMDEARAHYEAGIAIHRDVGDRRAEGTIVGNLGNLYLDLGLIDEAMALYDTALAMRREVGDRRAEGLILGNQGVALFEQRRFDEARAHLESALAIHREVNDQRAEGAVLGSLAEVLLEQGYPDEARAALAQAEQLLRQVGDPFEIGKLLSIRAELERRLGDAAVAMATLVEAETLAARIGAGRESELGQRLARLRQRIVTG